MATVGVKGILMAMINPETGKVITGAEGLTEKGIFDARGKVAKGVTQANISGMAPSVTKIWGNNILQDQSVGKAQPSVAANFNDLPHDVLEKALGHESDGKGGFMDNSDGVLPHLAMAIITQDLAGKDIYYCFYDGNLVPADKNIQTSNENETRDTDNLTYNPIAGPTGHVYKTFYAGDEGFTEDALLAEFFPMEEAQTPSKASVKSTK
ncbi:phage tail protein [Lentilactobacillus senioris]|uniref:phage tail protein n=1 Tax=Lentilactobacillus senioris TaxID=931534 RepID=UPI003D28E6A9